MTLTLEQQQAQAIAQARLRLQQSTQPSAISDVVQSLPQYGETALSSTVGLPGDVANLASKGVSYLGGPEMPHYTGSADVQEFLNRAQGGPLYQPQTTIGKGGNVAAALLPAAIGGPEAFWLKAATRAGAPAAAITGIEASSLPENIKPWLETAATVLTPYGAIKGIGGVLNTIRQGAVPTTAQLGKTTAILKRLHDMATNPAEKAQAATAWRTVSDRYQKAKAIETATAGMQSPAEVQQALSDFRKSGQAVNFTPVEQAELGKVIGGSTGMRVAKGVEATATAFSPFHSIQHLGAAGMLAWLAHHAGKGTPLSAAVLAGTPAAIALVARKAYPSLTRRQINRFVNLVKTGKSPEALSYSPLQAPLAAGLLPQDQEPQ